MPQLKMRQEIEEKESQDRDHLPYCTAVIMETLRYLVGFGLGAPRAIWEDLVVDGYKIPRGMHNNLISQFHIEVI